MLKDVYDRFIKSGELWLSFFKTDKNEEYDRYAEEKTVFRFPFQRDSVVDTELVRWNLSDFEEFEFIDSDDKFRYLLKKLSKKMDNRYYIDVFNKNFSGKSLFEHTPAIVMVSDKFLIADTLRIFIENYYRIDDFKDSPSIYKTEALQYLLKESVIYEDRQDRFVTKDYIKVNNIECHKGKPKYISPFHLGKFHGTFNDCCDYHLSGKFTQFISYSPGSVLDLIALNEKTVLENRIKSLESSLKETRSKLDSFNNSQAEYEILKSIRGY